MSTDKTGGYAFPHWDGPSGQCFNGMTLRDWFAGQALLGMLSRNRDPVLTYEKWASVAYQLADAMINLDYGPNTGHPADPRNDDGDDERDLADIPAAERRELFRDFTHAQMIELLDHAVEEVLRLRRENVVLRFKGVA